MWDPWVLWTRLEKIPEPIRVWDPRRLWAPGESAEAVLVWAPGVLRPRLGPWGRGSPQHLLNNTERKIGDLLTLIHLLRKMTELRRLLGVRLGVLYPEIGRE